MINVKYGVEIVMGVAYINPIKHDTPRVQIKSYEFVGTYTECKAYLDRSKSVIKYTVG